MADPPNDPLPPAACDVKPRCGRPQTILERCNTGPLDIGPTTLKHSLNHRLGHQLSWAELTCVGLWAHMIFLTRQSSTPPATRLRPCCISQPQQFLIQPTWSTDRPAHLLTTHPPIPAYSTLHAAVQPRQGICLLQLTSPPVLLLLASSVAATCWRLLPSVLA